MSEDVTNKDSEAEPVNFKKKDRSYLLWLVPVVIVVISYNVYQATVTKQLNESIARLQRNSADEIPDNGSTTTNNTTTNNSDAPAPPAPVDDNSQSVQDDTVPVFVSNAVPSELVGMTLTFNAVVGKLIFSFRDDDKVQITDTALDELYQQVADVSLDKAGNMTFKEYKKYYTVIFTASLNGNVITITSKGIDKDKPNKVTSAYDPMTMVIN